MTGPAAAAAELGVLFPGQGTLRVGMAAALRVHPAAAPVWDAADALLDVDVRALCARGPAPVLVATENAQPVVTVCGAAALAVLRDAGLEPAVVAGHSVGEIAALHAAGVLDLAATLRLVTARAALMGAITTPGAMLAVLGLPVAAVEELAAEAAGPGEPLVVGLENAPGHVVVSGAPAAVERCAALAPARGASRTAPLAVSGAFHSPLMAPAVAEWADVVAAQPFAAPRCPVVPNTTGRPTRDPDELRAALVDQLTGRVRWAATTAALGALGVRCVEAGDSKALTGLARAAEPPLPCVSMSDPTALRRLGARAPARAGVTGRA